MKKKLFIILFLLIGCYKEPPLKTNKELGIKHRIYMKGYLSGSYLVEFYQIKNGLLVCYDTFSNEAIIPVGNIKAIQPCDPNEKDRYFNRRYNKARKEYQ